MERIRRIYEEAVLAGALFSRSRRVQVDPGGGWVLIDAFPLPPGYNQPTTPVLILLPPNYPLTPPNWFYLKRGVRRADGSWPPHYFEETHVPEDLRRLGWAGGCLHILEWRPSQDPLTGHSLLTVCRLIEKALQRWLRG